MPGPQSPADAPRRAPDPDRRRPLVFHSYPDASREIEHLHEHGYTKLGNWSLGQICEHLAFYYRGSLDGFDVKLPWIVRAPIRWMFLSRLLASGEMPTGGMTVPKSVPATTTDERKQVQQAIRLLERLEQAEQLHPSPLFGALTLEQWRRLHLIHTAHHLRFLLPH